MEGVRKLVVSLISIKIFELFIDLDILLVNLIKVKGFGKSFLL